MSRLVIACMLAAFALAAPRDAGSQQPAVPNAAATRPADGLDDATRSEVLAARDAVWRAWFAHDTAALRRLLPRSTTAGEGNAWETRDEIVAGSLRSATSGLRLVGLRFDETRLHANGEVVVVFSHYTLELEREGQRNTITGNASEVFIRRDGVWQNPFWYLAPR
jgi:hypothetical protein